MTDKPMASPLAARHVTICALCHTVDGDAVDPIRKRPLQSDIPAFVPKIEMVMCEDEGSAEGDTLLTTWGSKISGKTTPWVCSGFPVASNVESEADIKAKFAAGKSSLVFGNVDQVLVARVCAVESARKIDATRPV